MEKGVMQMLGSTSATGMLTNSTVAEINCYMSRRFFHQKKSSTCLAYQDFSLLKSFLAFLPHFFSICGQKWTLNNDTALYTQLLFYLAPHCSLVHTVMPCQGLCALLRIFTDGCSELGYAVIFTSKRNEAKQKRNFFRFDAKKGFFSLVSHRCETWKSEAK